MNISRLLCGARAFAALTLALCCSQAYGDVVLEERVRVEGDGVMKMINMTSNTVTTIAGDRARTDNDLQMDSRLMRMFGGSGQTSEIVRLDEEKIYQLDPKKRTYTETTFAEQRAEMQQAMEQMREAQQSQQQGASGIDESECEWSAPTASSQRSGESQQIAGLHAERFTVTATQSCADRRSQQVCDFRLTLDQWLAAEYEDAEEALEYYRAYAEKLGLGAVGSRDFAQRAESMFAGYAGIWGELGTHLLEAQGYPLRSSMTLAIGGPECRSVQQAQASGQAAMPGVGETLGGALGGTLGGMLGRKRDTARTAPAEPAAAAAVPEDGMIRFMTINTELVSVRRQAADPQTFEVPANFKRAR